MSVTSGKRSGPWELGGWLSCSCSSAATKLVHDTFYLQYLFLHLSSSRVSLLCVTSAEAASGIVPTDRTEDTLYVHVNWQAAGRQILVHHPTPPPPPPPSAAAGGVMRIGLFPRHQSWQPPRRQAADRHIRRVAMNEWIVRYIANWSLYTFEYVHCNVHKLHYGQVYRRLAQQLPREENAAGFGPGFAEGSSSSSRRTRKGFELQPQLVFRCSWKCIGMGWIIVRGERQERINEWERERSCNGFFQVHWRSTLPSASACNCCLTWMTQRTHVEGTYCSDNDDCTAQSQVTSSQFSGCRLCGCVNGSSAGGGG